VNRDQLSADKIAAASAASDQILAVDHLGVTFGTLEVFRDVSFSVARGSSLAVIGPNGSGKSVLFRALIGAQPYSGVIRWAQGVRIGYVPQKLDIERDLPLTGRDFLRAKAAVVHSNADAIAHAVERVGIAPEILKRPIGAMSGGQFQRLLVAFALVGDPNVLMLDEPAAGVDTPGQERLAETLERLRERDRVTLMVISHDLSVVFRHATNVICLARGLKSFGPPREVLTPAMLSELYGTEIGFHVHDLS
jgi:zinc transport system ATP-binding protein